MAKSARNDRIMDLIGGGKSYGEVAAIIGISRCAVAGVVCRNRLNGPKKDKVTRARAVVVYGQKYSSICHAAFDFKVSASTVHRWIGLEDGTAYYA